MRDPVDEDPAERPRDGDRDGERDGDRDGERDTGVGADSVRDLGDSLPTEPRPRRFLGSLARRLLPWISLAVGVVSAVLMDRGPERAWIFATAAVLLWVTLVTLHWLGRVGDDQVTGARGLVLNAARFSSLFVTQSLVQLTLFFALPFYFHAATLDGGHILFLGLLCALSLASLWDPFTEWLLRHAGLSAILPATGSFVALTAVLPGLGLSTRTSLWLASFVAAAGVPILVAAQVAPGRRRLAASLAAVAALALPASLYFGAARIVPAAPLELVKGELGTQRDGKWIADAVEHLYAPPDVLICATAISSPLGLHDRLFHVWRKDGAPRARLELEIVGGRSEGYRTQSRISHFGKNERGEFSCTVETATGQVLGTRSVRIGPR